MHCSNVGIITKSFVHVNNRCVMKMGPFLYRIFQNLAENFCIILHPSQKYFAHLLHSVGYLGRKIVQNSTVSSAGPESAEKYPALQVWAEKVCKILLGRKISRFSTSEFFYG